MNNNFIYDSIVCKYRNGIGSIIKETISSHKVASSELPIRESVFGEEGYFYLNWLVIYGNLVKLKDLDSEFKKSTIGNTTKLSKDITAITNFKTDIELENKSLKIKRDMDENRCIIYVLTNLCHLDNYLTIGGFNTILQKLSTGDVSQADSLRDLYTELQDEKKDLRYKIVSNLFSHLDELALDTTPEIFRGDDLIKFISFNDGKGTISDEMLKEYVDESTKLVNDIPLGDNEVSLREFVTTTYTEVIYGMLASVSSIVDELKYPSSDFINNISEEEDLKKFKTITDNTLMLLDYITSNVVVAYHLFNIKVEDTMTDVIGSLNKLI